MGEAIVHKIVSNVDTIIILKNPCVEFAAWGQPAPSTAEEIEDAKWQYSWKMRKISKKKLLKKRRESAAMNENIAPEESSKVLEQNEFGAVPSEIKQEIAMAKVAEPGDSGHNESPQRIVGINSQKVEREPQVTTKPIEEEGICFQVCAGSLMSASPWFNRVLKKNGWMESNWNQEDRWFHISAEDWDEEAFVILMNIFHHRNRKVPRTVTLEMLAKIAILVDYYECDESVELFSDMWIGDLKEKTNIPTTYCRDLILWMLVSWTFGASELLKQTTAVAIQQCTEPVRNLGLPIPAWITDEIDLRRYRAIESILSGLHAQLNVYRSATYSCPISTDCSFRCGCMLLGALTKEMDSAKFMSPRPEIPFFGQSFDAICGKTRLMRSETWYQSRNAHHSCALYTFVNFVVDVAVASVEGVSLREKSTRMEAPIRT